MLIGIGGASRSGKTELSERLRNYLNPLDCKIIHQDDYSLPAEKIPKIKDEIDWEDPSGINFKKLKKDILKSKERYAHVIVEGFLVFYQKEIKDLFDYTVYLSIDKSTFLEVKKNDNRWGEVSDFYMEHIWKSHLLRGTVHRNEVDFYFDKNEFDLDQVQKTLINKISF